MNYLERSIGTKKIIWFGKSNQYALVDRPAFEVINKLESEPNHALIVKWFSDNYQISEAESTSFVTEISQMVEQLSTLNYPESDRSLTAPIPKQFYCIRFYNINRLIYRVDFETEQLEYFIHPKFAHLEVGQSDLFDQHFQLFRNSGEAVLMVNGEVIGQWLPEEEHFFTGKFSMELANKLYGKTESDWMAVFHASAMSRGNQSVLFLGDSGNGKSTLAAILMANGFDLLADDFVPVDAVSEQVFHFPAAISIKKNAVDYLLSMYPQLVQASEFYFPGMNKTVRYLPPKPFSEYQKTACPCKALVFVQYKKESGLMFDRISSDIAFQQLIPDSWISPLPENASRFLDWFLEMPCYRLTYSDDIKMVKTIDNLFRNEI